MIKATFFGLVVLGFLWGGFSGEPKRAPAFFNSSCSDAPAELVSVHSVLSGGSSGYLEGQAQEGLHVSVLEESQLQDFFRLIAGRADFHFGSIRQGCEYRAQAAALLLAENCIHVGKVFVTGLRENGIFVQAHWNHHVAPFLFVRHGDALIPYVIDPSVLAEAVPLEDWLRTIVVPGRGSFAYVEAVSPYTLLKEDIALKLREYRSWDAVKTRVALQALGALEVMN